MRAWEGLLASYLWNILIKYQVCISCKQTTMYNSQLEKVALGLTENFAITNLPSPWLLNNFVYYCINLKKCMMHIRDAGKSNILFILKAGWSFIQGMSKNINVTNKSNTIELKVPIQTSSAMSVVVKKRKLLFLILWNSNNWKQWPNANGIILSNEKFVLYSHQ